MLILFRLTSENVTRHTFCDGLVVLMLFIIFGIKLWIRFVKCVCGLLSTSSSRQHVLYSVSNLCALCRPPTANRTPWCFWISTQCTTILMPDGIHITNMNLDDEKPAPPWGHCGSQKAKQELHVNLAGTRTTYWSHVTRTMSNFQ